MAAGTAGAEALEADVAALAGADDAGAAFGVPAAGWVIGGGAGVGKGAMVSVVEGVVPITTGTGSALPSFGDASGASLLLITSASDTGVARTTVFK